MKRCYGMFCVSPFSSYQMEVDGSYYSFGNTSNNIVEVKFRIVPPPKKRGRPRKERVEVGEE